jgi:hypothetical protein
MIFYILMKMSIKVIFYSITGNVAMQILVADFGERQRPAGRDGHARIRGWMPHEPRYKICMVLATVLF